MPKAFYKHKILLDEHLFHRRAYPALNEHFDVKHIKEDLNLGGMDDPLIYELAVKQGRIILTTNVRHFRPLLREDSPGIIGIPEAWSANRLDTALTALFIATGQTTSEDIIVLWQHLTLKKRPHRVFRVLYRFAFLKTCQFSCVLRQLVLCLSVTPVSQQQTKPLISKKTPCKRQVATASSPIRHQVPNQSA
jgi:hypothetical protein